MASWYVYSGAAGSGTGANWANAMTTLAAAITAGAAGDTYYLAHDHAETQASALTLSLKGTIAAPDRFLSVNRAGSVPPVAADLQAGASITTTGTSAMTFQTGAAYFFGITFNSGTGTGAANLLFNPSGSAQMTLDTCILNLVGTSTSSRIAITSTLLNNCTASFGATGQGFNSSGGINRIRARSAGVLVTGATIPTNLFASTGSGHIVVSGVDLSASGAGKTLVISQSQPLVIRFINCRLHASVTVTTAPISSASVIELNGCSSTANTVRSERWLYQGTLTTETTIVRTGGASDGVTGYSWKIVTNANNKRDFQFDTFEGGIWNDTTGSSKTLTVHTVTDNVTLTDAEIWLEVEYLGSSSYPLATFITDANATILTTPANQASDSGTAWTTTGLTTPVKQKLEVTFTPQMAGPVRWRVRVAKTSTTVYVCPKAELI